MKTKHAATEATAGKDALRVFLKKDKAGGWRAKWYGRFMRNGKSVETSLCDWQGTPPETSTGTGNAVFEQSRERARKMLADAMDTRNDADDELRDARRVYALMYGHRVDRVKLADLWTRWNALPHKADLSEGWRAIVQCVLSRFVGFMGERFPKVKDAGALTSAHFQAFFEFVDGLGVSARAWNYHLTILRSVLSKVDGQSAGFRDYLSKLPKRMEATIHRRPFTGEELEAIFTAAREVDPELRPVLIAAACTALRRGDVATLRWDAVDMEDGFITVKTAKTGETVEIPIFPPLMEVLTEADKKRRRGVPYVFPHVALAYKAEHSALDRRLRAVLAAAGFTRPDKPRDTAKGRGGNAYKYPAPPSSADAEAMVEAGMRAAKWTPARREKGLEILRRHLEGQEGRAIARDMEIGKSSVSEYLHAMEDAGEIALVSPPKADPTAKATLAEARDGEQRKRRGSLCGWHSFRTTFCSLALAQGVPMELLTRITGHQTAAIVEKYYNQAKREQSRKAFRNAMPKAIAGAVEGDAESAEFVAVPAPLAGLLQGATAEQLEAVAAILKKGGGK